MTPEDEDALPAERPKGEVAKPAGRSLVGASAHAISAVATWYPRRVAASVLSQPVLPLPQVDGERLDANPVSTVIEVMRFWLAKFIYHVVPLRRGLLAFLGFAVLLVFPFAVLGGALWGLEVLVGMASGIVVNLIKLVLWAALLLLAAGTLAVLVLVGRRGLAEVKKRTAR